MTSPEQQPITLQGFSYVTKISNRTNYVSGMVRFYVTITLHWTNQITGFAYGIYLIINSTNHTAINIIELNKYFDDRIHTQYFKKVMVHGRNLTKFITKLLEGMTFQKYLYKRNIRTGIFMQKLEKNRTEFKPSSINTEIST